jgi:hypothetical protein
MNTTERDSKMITWQEWMLEIEELYQQARKVAQ